MKKIFIVIMMLLSLMLCSCGKMNLERSFDRLYIKGFTMEGIMEIKMSGRYIDTQRIEVEMLTELSSREVYSEMIIDGVVQRTYTKINKENEVEIYTLVASKWEKETVSLDEYEDQNETSLFDIDFEECFVLEDGVWIGDTELITEDLQSYYKSMIEAIFGTGTMSNFNVSKYNIEMSGRNISKVDIAVDFLTYISGMYITVQIKMPMDIINVGRTKVTVPHGLPE